MELVPSFLDLLQQISFVMTVPTFNSFVILVSGWAFAPRRTVTGMIVAAGALRKKHHSAFHRVFAAARWSLDELGLAVFSLLAPWLGQGTIFLAVDDTLARKRGLKIFGVGMHHDPLLSSRKKALLNWGHSWVVLGVVLRFPFRPDHVFCLPILFRLYVSKQTVARQGGRYRTRPQLAVAMLEMLCQRRKNRAFHVLADSAYGGQSVFRHLPNNCQLTSRLLLNARIHAAAPIRVQGQNGRPRRRGERLPTPEQMLHKRARRLTLHLYGRHDRVRLSDTVAYLYALPERPVRVVAVEPLTGGRPRQAFYSTDSAASAEQVLGWYAQRWSIEQAFQESKGHLGFEQPQGWTQKAVERSAPVAMLLYSLMVVWFAEEGHKHYRAPKLPWYRSKRGATFADILATLRCESVKTQVLKRLDPMQLAKNPVKTLIHVVKLAA